MRGRLLVIVVMSGCGGAAPPTRLSPPPTETAASLAPGRCADGVCRCRADGEGAEDPPPDEGTKRFELKVGSGPGTVWVTVNNSQVLLKTGEQVEQCFYLDLAAGKHEVVLRGQSSAAGGGVGASLRISEHSAKGWYDTFEFSCGLPGPCDVDGLRAWKQEVDGYDKSLRDPCGSTKLRGAQWETGRLPDGAHPDAIAAAVTLDVYAFVPEAGPGQCKNTR
jgi:hypothetical protein